MVVYTTFQIVWFGILVFDFVRHLWTPDDLMNSVAYRFFIVLVVLPLALVVSGLVLRRARGNVVGLCLLLWCVTIMGESLSADSPLQPYNGYINTGWTGLWLLGLFFPNGRSAFPRAERWIRLLSASCIALVVIWPLFQPPLAAPNGGTGASPNPFSVSALTFLQPVANSLELGLLLGVVLLIVPSFIVRYRYGDERSRLQLRWLGWAFGVLVIALIPLSALGILQNNPTPYGVIGQLVVLGFSIYASLFPYIAVGNALLRHRLYDIDIIIRRTLQYSLLTGLLGLVYFGSVVLLQAILGQTTGERSPLVLVLSTLLIAGLFAPLRRRIQNFIDRRFYRQKYDAAKVLADFARIARDETDINQLTARLVAVVQETLQPEQVTLWLKPTTQRRWNQEEIRRSSESVQQ